MTGPTITVSASVSECLSLFSALWDICLAVELFSQKAMFFRGPRTISMGATLCLLQPASPGTGSLKDVNILCAFTLLQIL